MLGSGNLPPGGGGLAAARRMSAAETDNLLPKYDPQSNFARREANRSRSAEKAIHVIPVFLLCCAMILWMFSTPPRISLASDVGAVRVLHDSGVSKAGHPPSIVLHTAEEKLAASSSAAVKADDDGGD